MPEGKHHLALHLLGPLRAWRGDREVVVGPPKQRAVLAVLAGHAGDVVSREQIVDALWGSEAPASAANAVHTYVAALRRALDPDRGSRESGAFIVSRVGGYELRVPADAVDTAVFVRRYGEAQHLATAGEHRTALARFESALGLWHGEALSGIPGPYAALERTRLREMRYAATEGWIAGLIAEGRSEAAVVAASEAIAQEPLRERLRHLHMLALFRCGRQAHAIQAYHDIRAVLRDELGIDPGPELRALHERILAGETSAGTSAQATSWATAPASPWTRNSTVRTLNQLPPTARVFIGRETELRQARHNLAEDLSERGSTAPILAIDGPAGVGKTAFALELSRECVNLFPDGQLYVDLRGSGRDRPRSAFEGLARLLQELGVEHDRLPLDLEGRVTLYRRLMHGRRMLVLLDNAADADQLRPLIPPGPTGVIVTSRRPQRGLVAREGARRIGLRPLDREAAAGLFAALLGHERCVGQHPYLEQLADYCGRLPLGIRIAAGTMAANPYLRPEDLAARYENPHTRLDHLCVEGDGEASVRCALEASYRALPAAAAQLFRALGRSLVRSPGRSGDLTISTASAAGLLGGDSAAVGQQLEVLADSGLLERGGPELYGFNELVRVYAMERAAVDEEVGTRSALLLSPIRNEKFTGVLRPELLSRR